MRKQELEEGIVEDYQDKNESVGKEAKSFAYSKVVDIMDEDATLDYMDPEDADALAEFPDLLEGIEDSLDIRNNPGHN